MKAICRLVVLSSLIFGTSARALSGPEHVSSAISSIFGREYLASSELQELVSFISSGMDYGTGVHPIDFSKPGSSFLARFKHDFPNFTAPHRAFGHWSFDGGIPSEFLEAFEKAYPGRRPEAVQLWREFVLSRRWAVQLATGMSKEGSATAQSLASLIGNHHDLCDWMTPDVKNLPPIDDIIRDIERSYNRIGGHNNQSIKSFISKLRGVSKSAPNNVRAAQLLEIWDKSFEVRRITLSNMKRFGFGEAFKSIDHNRLSRALARLVPLSGSSLTKTPTNSSETTPRTGNKTTGTGHPTPKAPSGKMPRHAVRPKIKTGTAVVRPAETAGKSIGKATGRGAAKAGGRGVLAILGRAAPIAVDVGFWMWGNYEINDDYTKGKISATERKEKKVVNTGRAVGGAAGAALGGAAGQYYNEKHRSASDGGGGGGGWVGFLIVLGGAILGGWIGDRIGGETTKTVYEWVNRSPYEICTDACKIGDVDAMFFKGLYYYEGRYCEQNKEGASGWFENAGREGDVRAQFYLGEYYKQVAEPNDPEAAAFWWDLAANSKASDDKYRECKAAASYNLAGCYFVGDGVDENEEKGLYYLFKASQLGNQQAKTDYDELIRRCKSGVRNDDSDLDVSRILGWHYFMLGGENNYRLSIKYMLGAAKAGDSVAMDFIGSVYQNGVIVSTNLAKAVEWYRKSANEGYSRAIDHLIDLYDANDMWDDDTIAWLVEQVNADHARACFRLGDFAIRALGIDEANRFYPFLGLSQNELCALALDLFYRAEDFGSIDASFTLACMLPNLGKSISALVNPVLYEHRLISASFHNNVSAQVMLAKAYESGKLLEKDETRAALFWALAALNGNAEAQSKYGDCCYFGRGTPKNLGKAARWFRLSAEQGNPYGEYNLGWCYLHGEGVEKNKQTARHWLQKAVKDGYTEAQMVLDNL